MWVRFLVPFSVLFEDEVDSVEFEFSGMYFIFCLVDGNVRDVSYFHEQ